MQRVGLQYPGRGPGLMTFLAVVSCSGETVPEQFYLEGARHRCQMRR